MRSETHEVLVSGLNKECEPANKGHTVSDNKRATIAAKTRQPCLILGE